SSGFSSRFTFVTIYRLQRTLIKGLLSMLFLMISNKKLLNLKAFLLQRIVIMVRQEVAFLQRS
ncbi:hypothetical protein, partial [Priestia megaterium]|uniref:hypothetical protein n=1 Tax=Priestia megaterium TaxID=1404 RepID=UPI0023DC3647